MLSAYSDYAPDLLFPWEKQHGPQMFPGGNTGVARHMVKALVPDAISGPATMAGICQARVNFAALDQPRQRDADSFARYGDFDSSMKAMRRGRRT